MYRHKIIDLYRELEIDCIIHNESANSSFPMLGTDRAVCARAMDLSFMRQIQQNACGFKIIDGGHVIERVLLYSEFIQEVGPDLSLSTEVPVAVLLQCSTGKGALLIVTHRMLTVGAFSKVCSLPSKNVITAPCCRNNTPHSLCVRLLASCVCVCACVCAYVCVRSFFVIP